MRTATKSANPNITIKKELLDDLGEEDENIEMISDEFDDTLNESLDLLTDNSVIHDLFDTDTLMEDFNNINNVIMSDPENVGNPNMEIIMCPICEDRMARGELSSHLEGCNGITVKINPKGRGDRKKPMPFYKNQTKPSTSTKTSQAMTKDRETELLLKAGYSREQIERLNADTREAREYNDRIMNELANDERQRRTSVIRQHSTENDDIETITLDEGSNHSSAPNTDEKHPCPVCSLPMSLEEINQHLDECLQSQMNS